MALAYRKQLDDTTAFGLWHITESFDELYPRLQLNDQEKAYLDSLSNGKRNIHWLATRVLLREMLETDQYIDCKIDDHGKPYLTNFPFHISLSHSFDYAAVMISENKPVGIDIEKIMDKIVRIQKKFLNEQELNFIEEEQRVEQLYTCWCAKEAIYKLHGKKNVSFKDNIHLAAFKYSGEGSFSANLHCGSKSQTFEVKYMRFDNYMVGLVF